MKGFKQCEKGHFYKDTLEECNYCPKNTVNDQETIPKTIPTEAISGISTEKTQVFSANTNLTDLNPEPEKKTNTFDPNKTTIGGEPL